MSTFPKYRPAVATKKTRRVKSNHHSPQAYPEPRNNDGSWKKKKRKKKKDSSLAVGGTLFACITSGRKRCGPVHTHASTTVLRRNGYDRLSARFFYLLKKKKKEQGRLYSVCFSYQMEGDQQNRFFFFSFKNAQSAISSWLCLKCWGQNI